MPDITEKITEQSEFDRMEEEARKGPRFFATPTSFYPQPVRRSRGFGRCTCRVWLRFEWYEGELCLELDSDPPHPDHLLTFAMEAYGLSSILNLDDWRKDYDPETFMLQNGIAPEQPFQVEAEYDWSVDYWGEYDEHWEWEIIAREPWPVGQVLDAWLTHFHFHKQEILCLTP